MDIADGRFSNLLSQAVAALSGDDRAVFSTLHAFREARAILEGYESRVARVGQVTADSLYHALTRRFLPRTQALFFGAWQESEQPDQGPGSALVIRHRALLVLRTASELAADSAEEDRMRELVENVLHRAEALGQAISELRQSAHTLWHEGRTMEAVRQLVAAMEWHNAGGLRRGRDPLKGQLSDYAARAAADLLGRAEAEDDPAEAENRAVSALKVAAWTDSPPDRLYDRVWEMVARHLARRLEEVDEAVHHLGRKGDIARLMQVLETSFWFVARQDVEKYRALAAGFTKDGILYTLGRCRAETTFDARIDVLRRGLAVLGGRLPPGNELADQLFTLREARTQVNILMDEADRAEQAGHMEKADMTRALARRILEQQGIHPDH